MQGTLEYDGREYSRGPAAVGLLRSQDLERRPTENVATVDQTNRDRQPRDHQRQASQRRQSRREVAIEEEPGDRPGSDQREQEGRGRCHEPERKVFSEHDTEDLPAGRPEGSKQRSLADALEPAGGERAHEHERARSHGEERHEAYREHDPEINPSRVCCSEERSSVVTLGNRSANRRWNAPRSVALSIRVRVTSDCGAFSSAPGAKTTKKLGSKRAHSTSLRLVMRVGISTP